MEIIGEKHYALIKEFGNVAVFTSSYYYYQVIS